ncbi:hypothetical protein RclHR1_16270001 [Rhizophagus clarus]|uniref:HTH CENPB-type domain-containing protein n=1 Tax=Rhizophagus clarus TaxID=94130 RepID=A0A2Z6QHB4_9GLOM|nr:hypothetical protein RclHR1_16270001 [Rhizophagus clarus]
MPVAPSAKRTRTAISENIKQQICVYATKSKNKNKTQQQVADYFNQQNPGLHIDRSTISKILGKKAKWLALISTSASKKTFRHREVKYPQVEKALGLWVENANANNLPVLEMMIKEKAFYFAQEFSIPREDILFSNGWIENLKNAIIFIAIAYMVREANSAPLETLFEERRKLQTILQDYTLDNIFNADETGFFFRMAPNQTLASAPTPGTKLDKTRITVLLATNAIGTQKLKPLVIGSSKNPRCLYRVNRNSLPCTYYANSKAWMRSDIFGEWLEYINNKFRTQNRKILLLIDNASSHFNPDDHNNRVTEHTNDNLNLSHVRVHFLPPNTTAHLQPMDAGIIKSFKAIYKQHYIRHIIHQFEANVNLKRYSNYSWDSVKVETIVNCWQKTEILPNNNDDVNGIQQALIAQKMANQEDQKGVKFLLQQFSSLENISDESLGEINQYLEMIDLTIPTEQPLTDAEIVQLIMEEENETPEMNDDDKEEHPVILMQEGFNSLKTWVQFFKEQGK